MTSLGPTWAAATGWDTVEEWAEARLRQRWGVEGTDFDQDGLGAALRDAVNESLPAGWGLDENQFVGPSPLPEDALDLVREVIDGIEFWDIAQYYDNGD